VLLYVPQLDIQRERLLLLDSPAFRVQKRNAAIRISVLQFFPIFIRPPHLARALLADGFAIQARP
jgi:hypothetical protein